jgi:hypothetical protein
VSSTTGAFLAMRLATTASNLAAGLGMVGTASRIGHKADEDLMNQAGVKRNVEDFAFELEVANNFSSHVVQG